MGVTDFINTVPLISIIICNKCFHMREHIRHNVSNYSRKRKQMVQMLDGTISIYSASKVPKQIVVNPLTTVVSPALHFAHYRIQITVTSQLFAPSTTYKLHHKAQILSFPTQYNTLWQQFENITNHRRQNVWKFIYIFFFFPL